MVCQPPYRPANQPANRNGRQGKSLQDYLNGIAGGHAEEGQVFEDVQDGGRLPEGSLPDQQSLLPVDRPVPSKPSLRIIPQFRHATFYMRHSTFVSNYTSSNTHVYLQFVRFAHKVTFRST